MSFELRPIRKSEIPGPIAKKELAGQLYNLASSCPTTKTRREHPSISGFLKPKNALVTVERVSVATETPEHPIEAYTVYSAGRSKEVLYGAALVVRDVDVQYNGAGLPRQMIRGKRSVCMAWLGVGGAKELAEVYAMLADQSGQGNEIAIEPRSSSPLVHDALMYNFPTSLDGGFVLGQGRPTHLSTAYGLSNEDLTILPRL